MNVAFRTARGRRWIAFSVVGLVGAFAAGRWQLDGAAPELSAVVERGPLSVTIPVSGVLQPAQSVAYRSPLVGREVEITFLAPEGLTVNQGDLLIRLDSTDLARELERAVQTHRQATIELQVAEADLHQAEGELAALSDGEGTLTLEEARLTLHLGERRVERLKKDHADLASLLERGYVTREELDRARVELEEAEAAAQLAKRKSEVLVGRTYPRDQSRAKLAVAQRTGVLAAARQRLAELSMAAQGLREAIAGCDIYARRPGLVVYEEYLTASPRRKIRVGDRVGQTQVIINIPEVARMQIVSSVREADVHLIRPGQRATVFIEAFPGQSFSGRVASVGSIARAPADRPADDKRFELIAELETVTETVRPEMTARLDVHVEELSSALLVPVNAVFEEEGKPVAYILRRWGSVERRGIAIGRSNGFMVAVTSGLNPGDRVRIAGNALGTKQ